MSYFLSHYLLPFCVGILIGIAILYIVRALSAISVNYKDYKYYKKQYEQLPHLTWYRPGKEFGLELNTVYGHFFDQKRFIYFTNTQDFKIDHENNIYLHSLENDFIKYDPISNYWYRKYRKWFDENLKDI